MPRSQPADARDVALRRAVRFAPGLLAALIVVSPTLGQAPFTDEAAARGVSYVVGSGGVGFGHGAAFADLDGDGDPDLVLIGRTDGVVGLYENDGTGQFIDRSGSSGISPVTDASGLSAADYDGDGDLDLYLTRWDKQNRLLENSGGWTFVDSAIGHGVDDSGPGHGSAWADFDGDGDLDLYLANRTEPSDNDNASRLYRNDGAAGFTDVLPALGMPGGDMTFQPTFFDHDLDGDPDLYISNDKCAPRNRLYRGEGGAFVDISAASASDACIDSMGVAAGDFNRDGRIDLYVTSSFAGNPLFLGQSDGTYLESASMAGVASQGNFAWGANFFDYDNDGHLELFVANIAGANRLFDHDGVWPASNLAGTLGLVDSTLMTFGSIVADVDLDGDLDLLTTNAEHPVRLFINHEGTMRHWLRLRVVGVGMNRFAVGARVEVVTAGVTQLRHVRAGSSYKSHEEMVLHVGLGSATAVDEIRAVWPDGATRTLAGFPADRVYAVYHPDGLGDATGDGAVRFDDALVLLSCVSGPLPGSVAAGCELMDFDGDADVDDADVASFLVRYTGPLHDCDGNGTPDLADIASGWSADSGNGVPDACESGSAPAGALAAPDDALRVGRGAASTVLLAWGASCRAGDGDVAVYEGPLGAYDSGVAVACTADGASSLELLPGAGDRFFIVVPHNGAREGTHGSSASGPRIPPAAACLPQQIGACP